MSNNDNNLQGNTNGKSIIDAVEIYKKQEAQGVKKLQKDKKNLQDYIRLFKLYYLPIIVIVFFILIVVIGIIPSVRRIQGDLNSLDKVNKEFTLKQDKLENLKQLKLQSSSTRQYLLFINKIAPVEKTNVSQFQQAIFDVAKKDNLNIIDAEGGEEIVITKDEDSILQLIEIPITFNIVGSFYNLKTFLSDIYKQDDFIIIKEMDFSRVSNTSPDWKLKVTLIKYQFVESDDEENFVKLYSKIPSEVRPNQTVLEFLQKKYNINQ